MGSGVATAAALSGRRRRSGFGLPLALLCLAAAAGWLAAAPDREGATAPTQAEVRELLGGLRFEANRGQVDRGIDFIARGAGYEVSLSGRGASVGLERDGARAVVGMSVVGADPGARAAGVGDVVGRSNYLIGSDRSAWHRNVPSFGRVRYAGVYPGIDMVYHGSSKRLEYDFLVTPGADPDDIALAFSGGRVSLAGNGDLLVRARGGTLRQKAPVTYQHVGGARREVPSRFVLGSRGRVGFELGRYDRSRPLVIDPQLVYSTYIGGGAQGEGVGGFGAESGEGVDVDASGNAYVVGSTNTLAASPYPITPGAFQTTPGAASGSNIDAVVTKVNPSGSGIVYSTYLGGGGADRAYSVAVNANGEAYVTGQTNSSGATPFPTTQNAIQGTFGGGTGTGTAPLDAFVAKLNAAGNNLVYSTYLGGSGNDRSFGIGIDSTGAAYVAGLTPSTNFPTTPGAFDTTHNTADDAFVTKLNAAGTALVYSTYLGGAGADGAEAIAVDGATGVATVAGGTAPGTFPTTVGAFQTTRSADAANTQDAFVTRLNAAGSALDYSTFLSGAGSDRANGVAIDSGGAAYVTGATASGDFPTASPLQGTRAGVAGDDDVFVTKLNAAGSAPVYSTYFGGGSPDQGNAIDVDGTGAAYVGGATEASGNFPVTNPIGRRSGNQDAILFKLNPAGSAAVYSTVLGSTDGDTGWGVAVGPGGAYLVGAANTFSFPPANFPTTPGAFQAQPPGGTEIFLAKVAEAPPSPLVTSVRSRSGPTTGGTRVTINGTGFTGATAVRFGGTPAASFTVDSPTRITAVSPARGLGKTTITVTTPAGTTPANPAAAFEYAEGAWAQTGSTANIHFSAPLVLLRDGRVLLPSGQTTKTGPVTPVSEIYDPKTRTWTATGSMATARHTHTATLLSGPACRGASPPAYCGKVLVAGGFPSDSVTGNLPVTDSAELFDPQTGTWSSGGTMNVRRALHAALLLDGPPCRGSSPPSYCGKVLVAGGRTCNQAPPAGCAVTGTNTAELYDPATGTWTPTTGPMQHQRRNFELGTLPDGTVVAPSGFGTDATSAETYNPVTGTWSATGPLRSRARTSAAMMPDGRILAVSGFLANNTVDVLDPVSRQWSPAANTLNSYRFNYYYATLPTGKVLFAGGSSGGESAEAYDPKTDKWVSAGLLYFAYGPVAGLGDTNQTVVLSSDPDKFAADSAKCGSDCGKVLVAGNIEDKAADLYTHPPELGSVSPTSGPGAGGTVVTITGKGFTHGLRSVRFGGTPAASFRADSYGRITAVAPPHAAGAVTVTVVTDGGAASKASAFGFTGRYDVPSQPSSFSGCPTATANVIRGTSGADVLTGTARGDRIFAEAGSDRVDGRAGADCIDLGAGADRGAGSSGADLIRGGIGRDRISGGSGGDRLRGGSSADTISGGGSRDRITGDGGNDRLSGQSGNDSLTGGSGRDRISGGSGRDRISGGSGSDRISARDRRRDTITCGSGRDHVTADRIDRVSRNCERVRRR